MEGNGSNLNLVDSVDKDCKITMFGAVQYGTAHSANSPSNFRANYIKMIFENFFEKLKARIQSGIADFLNLIFFCP